MPCFSVEFINTYNFFHTFCIESGFSHPPVLVASECPLALKGKIE
jgi:hypothetical protein